MRAVVEEILVDEMASGKLQFIVHWKGGTHTTFEMDRPQSANTEKNAVEDVDMIRRMAVRYGDDIIAGSQGHGATLSQGHGARETERTTGVEIASDRLSRPQDVIDVIDGASG
ncbi:MAG TPA: hypothetical protein VM925_01280, partial [Labilithrix sp.]|nr:hypothetical protein [Labilithrix sp.]